MENKFARTT